MEKIMKEMKLKIDSEVITTTTTRLVREDL